MEVISIDPDEIYRQIILIQAQLDNLSSNNPYVNIKRFEQLTEQKIELCARYSDAKYGTNQLKLLNRISQAKPIIY